MDFLAKALSALPSVAGSPLALGAYLAAIVAWVIIAWRVNRNKQLLRNLDKLPEKVRLEALRMEMGAVRLKSGLSPEQWLRSRIHLYYFLGFAILALVGTALFTISAVTAKDPGTVGSDVTLFQENPGEAAAPSAVPSGVGGVRLASLHVENAYDGSGLRAMELQPEDYAPSVTLTYSYDREGQEIRIRPEMPYLSLLERGGPIVSLGFDPPFLWQFPKLSVKVVNNTARTLLLSEAILDVKASTIDRNPVLVIPSSYDLLFTNAGWGNVNDSRVDFGIAELDACADPAIDDAPRPITVDLGSFEEESETIPIRLGGHVPQTFAGQTEVCVHGTIAFRTDDGEERSLKFRAQVPIDEEGGRGEPEGPSCLYDVFLEAGRSGQSQRVAVSQTIKPGEADHFVFRIASDRSARFDLGLSLRDASGAILPLQDVRLDLFVPRPRKEQVAEPPLL